MEKFSSIMKRHKKERQPGLIDLRFRWLKVIAVDRQKGRGGQIVNLLNPAISV